MWSIADCGMGSGWALTVPEANLLPLREREGDAGADSARFHRAPYSHVVPPPLLPLLLPPLPEALCALRVELALPDPGRAVAMGRLKVVRGGSGGWWGE